MLNVDLYDEARSYLIQHDGRSYVYINDRFLKRIGCTYNAKDFTVRIRKAGLFKFQRFTAEGFAEFCERAIWIGEGCPEPANIDEHNMVVELRLFTDFVVNTNPGVRTMILGKEIARRKRMQFVADEVDDEICPEFDD